MKKTFIILFIIMLTGISAYAKKETSAPEKTLEYLNISWWEKYHDDFLKDNLLTVYKNNYDLKNTALKIKENEKMVKMQFANELPFLSFSGDLNRDLQAPRQRFGEMEIPKYSQYNYNLPITAGYEIDIWGLNRYKRKSLEQQLEWEKQAQRATYISLTSDFAVDYFNLIKADKLLQLQNELIKTQEKILTMTQDKYETGLCSVNEVLAEEKYLTLLKEEKNNHDLTKKLLNETLKVYLANNDDVKRNNYENIVLLKDIPKEYSSSIIENRPDYKQSEANIKKIGFDVKAAKREFLPKFTLAGQIGLNAYTLNTLFDGASQFLNLGILPYMDLFSGGRKTAFLKFKKYQYEEALNDYQKTILEGIKEMNSGLIEYNIANDNYSESVKRLKTQTKIYTLAKEKNEIGASADIDALYAKEAYLLTQKEEVSNKINLLITTIGLYKAAGGADLYSISNENL